LFGGFVAKTAVTKIGVQQFEAARMVTDARVVRTAVWRRMTH
jgi:hypothetical protein